MELSAVMSERKAIEKGHKVLNSGLRAWNRADRTSRRSVRSRSTRADDEMAQTPGLTDIKPAEDDSEWLKPTT